jgi:hypothetical protein
VDLSRTGRTAYELIRAREWREHKLAALAGTGYATVLVGNGHVRASAAEIALVLVAVALAASFVSVLNDWTDLEDDRRAGKHNRLEGRPAWVAPVATAAIVMAGAILTGLAWSGHSVALLLYAGSWVAFVAYSAPPLRLKRRGAAGAVADAVGAHLCPHLLMVAVVAVDTPHAVGTTWPWLVGVWSAALGVRAALWHQFADRDFDARGRTGTFARSHPRAAALAGRAVAFPLELAAFAGMLVVLGEVAPWIALGLYAVLAWRGTRHGVRVTVIGSAPVFRIAMHSYYVVLFPLAVLVAAATHSAADALVLAGHLMLFPAEALQLLQDLRLLR